MRWPLIDRLAGPDRYVPVSAWSASAATAAVLAMVLAAGFCGAMSADVARAVAVRDMPAQGPGPWPAIGWLLGFQAALLSLGLIAARLFAASGREAADMLAWRRPAGGVGVVVAAFMLLALFACGYALLATLLDRQSVARDLAPAIAVIRTDAWPAAFLAIAIGAPLAEEVVFRGFLFAALASSRLGLVGAALVSTLGWTVLHAGYSVLGLIEVFVIGLYFCWLLVRTGSLWVPLACHALYNAALAIGLKWLPWLG